MTTSVNEGTIFSHGMLSLPYLVVALAVWQTKTVSDKIGTDVFKNSREKRDERATTTDLESSDMTLSYSSSYWRLVSLLLCTKALCNSRRVQNCSYIIENRTAFLDPVGGSRGNSDDNDDSKAAIVLCCKHPLSASADILNLLPRTLTLGPDSTLNA